jgi:hypothetical protein
VKQQHAFQITVNVTYNVVFDTDTAEQAREAADELDVATLAAAAEGRVTEVTHLLGRDPVFENNLYTVTPASTPDGVLTVSLCGEDDHVPGILYGCDTDHGIQRCDSCDWYDGDLGAAAALARRFPGAVVRWLGDDGITRDGTDVPDGVLPAPEQAGNPWLELDGTPIDFTTTAIPALPTSDTTTEEN